MKSAIFYGVVSLLILVSGSVQAKNFYAGDDMYETTTSSKSATVESVAQPQSVVASSTKTYVQGGSVVASDQVYASISSGDKLDFTTVQYQRPASYYQYGGGDEGNVEYVGATESQVVEQPTVTVNYVVGWGMVSPYYRSGWAWSPWSPWGYSSLYYSPYYYSAWGWDPWYSPFYSPYYYRPPHYHRPPVHHHPTPRHTIVRRPSSSVSPSSRSGGSSVYTRGGTTVSRSGSVSKSATTSSGSSSRTSVSSTSTKSRSSSSSSTKSTVKSTVPSAPSTRYSTPTTTSPTLRAPSTPSSSGSSSGVSTRSRR
ncbi:MAG: hypothetical protein SNH01_09320 [Rikenellaceae bacterium]